MAESVSAAQPWITLNLGIVTQREAADPQQRVRFEVLIILAVAHQGEEFVLILPAILLVGALFILRWANAPEPDSDEASQDMAPPNQLSSAD